MKKYFSMTIGGLCLALLVAFSAGTAQAAPKLIILIGDNIPADTPNTDQTIIDFIHTIYTTGTVTIEYDPRYYTRTTSVRAGGGILGAHPQSDIDHLNTADLIIISPSVFTSTSYINDTTNTPTTADRYNSLIPPLIVATTASFVRGTTTHRLDWVADNTNPANIPATTLTVPAGFQSDPIFTGVTITGGVITMYNAGTTLCQGITAGSGFTFDAANATNIGTPLAWGNDSEPFLIRWNKSTTAFFTGSAYHPVNDRWFINFLHSPGSAAASTFDNFAIMTADGKRLLKNIFLAELPAGPPPPNEAKAWTLFE